MASLRETKDRIGSVRSTLKITSAMKLVASSKLRKAQNAIETLRPYEEALQSILASASSGVRSAALSQESGRAQKELDDYRVAVSFESGRAPVAEKVDGVAGRVQGGGFGLEPEAIPNGVAVVAISSNSSLCGGFNANVIRKALEVISDIASGTAVSAAGRASGNASGDSAGLSDVKNAGVTVFSLGRRMADAMKKAGYQSPADYNSLVAHPVYDDIRALAEELSGAYMEGRFSRVVLVYNHFVSTSKQVVVVEPYLPFGSSQQSGQAEGTTTSDTRQLAGEGRESGFQGKPASETSGPTKDEWMDYYLYEPDAGEIVRELLPKVIALKLFAAVLDSAAAEHAARTVAMQTATDNAQELLGDLTLEYNKGRQQKITAEILDLMGGAAQ